jgi:hypothetical protein
MPKYKILAYILKIKSIITEITNQLIDHNSLSVAAKTIAK